VPLRVQVVRNHNPVVDPLAGGTDGRPMGRLELLERGRDTGGSCDVGSK